MKAPTIVCLAALLAACATTNASLPTATPLALQYGDLDIATVPGRAELVARVQRSARLFCRHYDPQDEDAIHDQGLLNRRYCPATAADILIQAMPTRLRRAYQAEMRGK